MSHKDEEFINLAAAIVNQAKTDYYYALLLNNKAEKNNLEAWFLSEWGQELSVGHGQAIIDEARRKVNNGYMLLSTACKAVKKKCHMQSYCVARALNDCAACGIEIKKNRIYKHSKEIASRDLWTLIKYVMRQR